MLFHSRMFSHVSPFLTLFGACSNIPHHSPSLTPSRIKVSDAPHALCGVCVLPYHSPLTSSRLRSPHITTKAQLDTVTNQGLPLSHSVSFLLKNEFLVSFYVNGVFFLYICMHVYHMYWLPVEVRSGY